MQARRLISLFLLSALCVLARPAFGGEYVLFYHNDALGSPVALTDSAGNVMWQADYEPFGNLATLTETLANTHQFIGKEVDAETSLHYLGARFYDGSLGRFLSVDPVLLRGRPASALTVPQRLNLYVYSTNNPYRYLDPSGQFGQLVLEAYNWISLGLSLFAYQSDPSFSNGLAVGLDLIGVASLGNLPALGGIVRGVGAAEKAATAARNAGKFEGAAKGFSAEVSWGNRETLERHFRDHGADFGAKNAEDYARQASEFLQRSQAEGLSTKVDANGVIRVYDSKSNTFGAYNSDGTTRTFLKPDSPTYWDRQPGTIVSE